MLIILFRLLINEAASKMLGAGHRPLDKQVCAYLSIQKCRSVFASIYKSGSEPKGPWSAVDRTHCVTVSFSKSVLWVGPIVLLCLLVSQFLSPRAVKLPGSGDSQGFQF